MIHGLITAFVSLVMFESSDQYTERLARHGLKNCQADLPISKSHSPGAELGGVIARYCNVIDGNAGEKGLFLDLGYLMLVITCQQSWDGAQTFAEVHFEEDDTLVLIAHAHPRDNLFEYQLYSVEQESMLREEKTQEKPVIVEILKGDFE